MPGFVPRFSAVVDKHGRVRFDHRSAFDTYASALATKHVEITIQPWQKKRTLAQLRAYFGLIVNALAEETGYEVEEVHRILKQRFKVKTTTKMTTAELENYQDRIRRWAATDLDIQLAEPNEVSL